MDNELNMEEYIQKNYPLLYKAIEELKDGSAKLNQIIDQFYFNIRRLVQDKDEPILVGRFVAEMAKAIAYISEEPINQDDDYFVLLFSDITEINIVSMCHVHIIERHYFVYNSAMQFVTILPDPRYIYKHEESCRYMMNFIEAVRNQYQVFRLSNPVEINPPIRMRLDGSEMDKDMLVGINKLNHYLSAIATDNTHNEPNLAENAHTEPDPTVQVNTFHGEDNNSKEADEYGNQ